MPERFEPLSVRPPIPAIAALGTGLLAVAGAVAGWLLFTEPESDAREVAGASSRAVPVETVLARFGVAATLIRATGTLKASDSVVIQPEVSGRVVELLFEQGQAVTAGTPLVQLETRTLQAELDRATAALALATQNYRRSESLSRRGATATQALDEARAALATAEAEVELAQFRIEHATIRAPFDSVIGLKEISVGRYVEPGDELVALERIDPLNLDFRLSERWLTKLRPGDAVAVTVDAVPGQTFQGRIVALAPQVDVNGRAVQLRALLPNAERILRPGLFARVTLELDARSDAVLVPEAAIVLQQAGAMLYRVEDGKAVRTPVTTGVRRDGMVEVTEGVAAGDTVIVNGHVRLRDQIRVEPVQPAGSG